MTSRNKAICTKLLFQDFASHEHIPQTVGRGTRGHKHGAWHNRAVDFSAVMSATPGRSRESMKVVVDRGMMTNDKNNDEPVQWAVEKINNTKAATRVSMNVETAA